MTVSAGPLIIRAVQVAVENFHLLTGFECKSCFREQRTMLYWCLGGAAVVLLGIAFFLKKRGG